MIHYVRQQQLPPQTCGLFPDSVIMIDQLHMSIDKREKLVKTQHKARFKR
jgi:hypothetical protein